jgi:hypothetical protein
VYVQGPKDKSWILEVTEGEKLGAHSRECRDVADAHEPGTCKHGKAKLPAGQRQSALYCDDSGKEAAYRSGNV